MSAIRKNSEPAKASRRRIETQIHRRKKAPPVAPLQAEWDQTDGDRPTRLRTPSEKMINRRQPS
jgi:hypothetical protein